MRRILLLLLLGLCGLAGAQALPQLAVMPLESKGVPTSEVSVISDALTNELTNSGKVRVLERGQMDQILKEQGFQQSGACDGGSCAIEMGRLLGVQQLVVGSVGLVGSTYVLNARTVDVKSGEVLRSVSRKRAGAIDEVLTVELPVMARDLVGGYGTKSSEVQGGSGSEVAGKGGSSWVWWTVGGVAVAAGATAAVLLSSSKTAAAPAAQDVPTADYFVEWTVK